MWSKKNHLLIFAAALVMFLTAGLKDTMGFAIHSHTSEISALLLSSGAEVVPGFFQQQSPYSDSYAYQGGDQSGVVDTLWHRFQSATLKVRILVIVMIYLIVSIILLFFAIILHRQVKTSQRSRNKLIKEEYQEQLANFLFDDESSTIKFRDISKRLNRQILIDEIMDLHNNLHGEVAIKLKDLYFNLGLHNDSLRKVYKGRWDVKAKAFGELAQMDVKDANKEISRYVNARNQILRMEAQVAMVKLSENDPLGFLDNLKQELTYWEQINIHDTLLFHSINIDSFERWLDNKNTSVVLFALRMIGLFKQVESGEKVRELLFSENAEIALAAVQAMKSLELAEYAEDLKILYKSESLKLESISQNHRKEGKKKEYNGLEDILPRKIRHEIIHAFRPIATAGDIPFLEQVAKDSENLYKARILALSIIHGILPEGVGKLDDVLNTADELVKKMIINVKQNQES
jgi:hypothetical protein